ncbi:MAG: hypothetical protein NC340_08075 [Ruminococcus flavefaciens]|nr:hypothetical protein [Ruminococcus flavefaciens]MCM1229935.1 hypothetical protein [Ruminococcus flavefaciens]
MTIRKILPALAVCLVMACGAGTAMANDNEEAFYVGSDGTIYTDAEMTDAVPHKDKSEYGINANGETFGNCLDVMYVEDEPDLMAAIGDNGTEGYIRRTEADGEMPANPEEAVRMMQERATAPPRVINVYESDGVTIIDTFTIGDRIVD